MGDRLARWAASVANLNGLGPLDTRRRVLEVQRIPAVILPKARANRAEWRARLIGFDKLTQAFAGKALLQATLDPGQQLLIAVRASIAGGSGDEYVRIAAQIYWHHATTDAVANPFKEIGLTKRRSAVE